MHASGVLHVNSMTYELQGMVTLRTYFHVYEFLSSCGVAVG